MYGLQLMFGILVSGRLPRADFGEMSWNKAVIYEPNFDNVTQFAVFLTGKFPIPADKVAAVYFSFPEKSPELDCKYAGFISNEKPSAIFKIAELEKEGDIKNPANSTICGNARLPNTAQIVVWVDPGGKEPRNASLSDSLNAKSKANKNQFFGKTMLESFFNFKYFELIANNNLVARMVENFQGQRAAVPQLPIKLKL